MFLISKFRMYIATILVPFIRVWGKIRSPWMLKRGLYEFYDINKIVLPGDVILTTTLGEASNLVNPSGKSGVKHAILVYGSDVYKGESVIMIQEAIGAGVVRRPLLECVGEKDRIIIVRPSAEVFEPTKKNITKMQKFLDSIVGSPYDYRFNLSEDALKGVEDHNIRAFYCSEMAYLTFKYVDEENPFELREVLGVKTVTPADFYDAAIKGEKFSFIYDNRNTPKPKY